MAQGRTVRTPEKGDLLVAKLARGYSIAAACRAERIARSTYYEWRDSDPGFASLADAAIEAGTDLLEDEAKRRAIGPGGSDTLLIFLLKARRPDKYAERKQVDVTIQIRKKAEQLAEQLGVPVADVIKEAEAVAAGAWDTWSP
jgi:hypothetical protein